MAYNYSENYFKIKEKENDIRFNLESIGYVYDDLPVYDKIINLYASKEVYADLIDEYSDANDKESLHLALLMHHTFESHLEGYIEGIKEFANDEKADLIDQLIETLDNLDDQLIETLDNLE